MAREQLGIAVGGVLHAAGAARERRAQEQRARGVVVALGSRRAPGLRLLALERDFFFLRVVLDLRSRLWHRRARVLRDHRAPALARADPLRLRARDVAA